MAAILESLGDALAFELGAQTADAERRSQARVRPSHVLHTRWDRLALIAIVAGALAGVVQKSAEFAASIAGPLLLLVAIGWGASRALRPWQRRVRDVPPPNDR